MILGRLQRSHTLATRPLGRGLCCRPPAPPPRVGPSPARCRATGQILPAPLNPATSDPPRARFRYCVSTGGPWHSAAPAVWYCSRRSDARALNRAPPFWREDPPDFPRYLSHSITIPSHAQEQEHQHGTYAAGLPGICDVNLVSHTMGDDISVGHPHNQLPAPRARTEPPQAGPRQARQRMEQRRAKHHQNPRART